ncbi:MAG TPA: hypothetical protein V6C85_33425 [Allocoleopsis sp.]
MAQIAIFWVDGNALTRSAQANYFAIAILDTDGESLETVLFISRVLLAIGLS